MTSPGGLWFVLLEKRRGRKKGPFQLIPFFSNIYLLIKTPARTTLPGGDFLHLLKTVPFRLYFFLLLLLFSPGHLKHRQLRCGLSVFSAEMRGGGVG